MINTNPLWAGMRGALGKTIVFKQVYGKTIITNFPRKPDKRKETQAQRKTRDNMRCATDFAKHVLKDPVQRAYYEKVAERLKLRNAYTAAVTEYMRGERK